MRLVGLLKRKGGGAVYSFLIDFGGHHFLLAFFLVLVCFIIFTGGRTRFGSWTGRLVVVVVVERFGAEHGAGLLVVCMRVVMDGRMESGGAVGRHRSG